MKFNFNKPVSEFPVLIFTVFALILGLGLNYSLFKNYAYSDAYEFVWSGTESPVFINAFIQGGRPLYGVLNQWIFGSLIDGINDLKWLRMTSGIMSVLLSVQVFVFLLKKMNWSIVWSSIFSFSLLMLPSFTVYFGWSVTYEIPIALNASFLGGTLFLSSITAPRLSYLKIFTGVFLSVVALSLYQPAGTAFLIPFVIYYVHATRLIIKSVIQLAVFYCITFALYYALFQFVLKYSEIPPLERAGMNLGGLPKNIINFYFTELTPILGGSFILTMKTVMYILGLILFLSFFLWQKLQTENVRNGIFKMVFFLGILPISYLPNLLSVDQWVSTRVIAPAAIIVLFYQFFAVKKMIEKFSGFRYFATGLVVLFVIVGSYNQNVALAGLQAEEYKLVRSEVERVIDIHPEKIQLVVSSRQLSPVLGILPRTYSDEFGIFSTAIHWVPVSIFNQIVKEKQGVQERFPTLNYPIKGNGYKLELWTQEDSLQTIDGVEVIDFQKLMINEF